MKYVPLNDQLITSAVCTQCASCCKSTSKVSNKISQSSVDYYKAIHLHPLKNNVQVIVSDKDISVRTWCAQLQSDLSCGIYATRPEVCSRFNCFTMANRDERIPESYDKIVNIIKRVHPEASIFA